MTAIYSDDVSILDSTSSLTQVQSAAQNAVRAVDNWSKKLKQNLKKRVNRLYPQR